ncbi:MAG: U32 family peptidase [Oscillospiraceae bacterium]|nr:U32 family peptidase [Oscillospiraceae bacterium]
MRRIEVLSPAGDMERLTMALAYGADAVYLAGTRFGMRSAAGNFALGGQLESAVELCHSRGVRVHVACNAILRNDDVASLPEFLQGVEAAGADAIIAADMGVIAMAKKYAPHTALHVSTQAGVASYAAASAFYDMGASRVILARELTLEEIAQIRAKTPSALELEVFVHGSMCMSFSGRCLLSNYLTGRDANQGSCAQPCRWSYHVVEEKRPGQYMELTEDGGTYIFNSRDLCMIDHIPELMDAGVDSIKIEGRMKSAYYAGIITNAYRHAADAAMEGRALEQVWRDEVNKVSHRQYSTGFFYDKNGPGQYYDSAMYFADCDVVAIVDSCDAEGNALLTQRNKFYAGDELELITPADKPVSFVPHEIFDAEGNSIPSTPHPMMELHMKLPFQAPRYSIIRKNKG